MRTIHYPSGASRCASCGAMAAAFRPLRHAATCPAPMPEWRRRALEQRDARGLVAVADTTGAVSL